MQKRKLLLFNVAIATFFGVCAALVSANDPSFFNVNSTNDQTIVFDNINAPLVSSKAQRDIMTSGGGVMSMEYSSPSLKEGGKAHFTGWSNSYMRNYRIMKGIKSIAVTGSGNIQVKAGNTFDEYQYLSPRYALSETPTVFTFDGTHDYFGIYATNTEITLTTVSVVCACSPAGEYEDNGDLLVHATGVYNSDQTTLTSERVTVDGRSAIKITGGSGWPRINFKVPGLNTYKGVYECDVKFVGTVNWASTKIVESGESAQAFCDKLSVGTWHHVALNEKKEGETLSIGFDCSSAAVEFYITNLKLKEYGPKNFTASTQMDISFSSNDRRTEDSIVTFDYKFDAGCEDKNMKFFLGNWTDYKGHFYAKADGTILNKNNAEVTGFTVTQTADGWNHVVFDIKNCNWQNNAWGGKTKTISDIQWIIVSGQDADSTATGTIRNLSIFGTPKAA